MRILYSEESQVKDNEEESLAQEDGKKDKTCFPVVRFWFHPSARAFSLRFSAVVVKMVMKKPEKICGGRGRIPLYLSAT